MSLYAAMQVAVGGLTAPKSSASIGNISVIILPTRKQQGSRVRGLRRVLSRWSRNPTNFQTIQAAYARRLITRTASKETLSNRRTQQPWPFQRRLFPCAPRRCRSRWIDHLWQHNILYARRRFQLDKSGYLVNGSGYYLTGYSVDSNSVVDTSAANPIRLSDLLDIPLAHPASIMPPTCHQARR